MVVGAAVVVVAAPSRHTAVHWAPAPTFFLSDAKRTLRPFLAAFPVKVTASGAVEPQYLNSKYYCQILRKFKTYAFLPRMSLSPFLHLAESLLGRSKLSQENLMPALHFL